MKFSESLAYLNSFLNLERTGLGPRNRTWNLDRTKWLLAAAGHPERRLNSIIIAGTKGKGSTGFFLESILRNHGISTGFYCSPHLEDPRERIRLNGKPVSRRLWSQAMQEVRRRLQRHPIPKGLGTLTYFEVMTFLAVQVFALAGVRAAIFEVGMGGRLDATNALGAPLVLLTPIHYDHEAFLGRTLKKIAAEKAAVIHSGAIVISAKQHPEARGSILARCRQEKARLIWIRRPVARQPGLAGEHQKWNAALAVKAAGELREYFGWPLKAGRFSTALASASAWPGRLESWEGKPSVLLDVAHNPASVIALVRFLKRGGGGKAKHPVLIFGTSRDKKAAAMLQELGTYFKEVIVTEFRNPRSFDVRSLMQAAAPYFQRVLPAADSESAFRLAGLRTGPKGRVVAAGSFYLVGEIRTCLRRSHRLIQERRS